MTASTSLSFKAVEELPIPSPHLSRRERNFGSARYFVAAFLLLLAVPAAAQPEVEVEQRAFEQMDSGVFIRGSGNVRVKVEERCHPACGENEHCDIACREAACDAHAAPEARCNQCRWTCVR